MYLRNLVRNVVIIENDKEYLKLKKKKKTN